MNKLLTIFWNSGEVVLQRRVLHQTGERSDGGMEGAHVAGMLPRVRYFNLFVLNASLVHSSYFLHLRTPILVYSMMRHD